MRRTFLSMALILSLFAARAYGQLILAQPGQVVAGKTLLSASQPDLALNDVVFIGEFDEAPEDDVVDLRQGVFMLNVNSGNSQLLAWTGKAEVGGSVVTEISSPKINGFGEVLYRATTANGSAVMDGTGAVVAQQGTEIAPGMVLGDIKALAINTQEKYVIDDSGIYSLAGHSIVSPLPFNLANQEVTEPRYFDVYEGVGTTFTNEDSVFLWVPPSSGNVQAGPGDVIDNHEIARAFSLSVSGHGRAIVAALSDGKTALFQSEELVLQEGDHVGNRTIMNIAPNMALTGVGRLVFSASLDGQQAVLMVPEPSAFFLAVVALSVLVMRRRRLL